MTTDLRTLFKEESNKLSIKEKEFKSLILDFEHKLGAFSHALTVSQA